MVNDHKNTCRMAIQTKSAAFLLLYVWKDQKTIFVCNLAPIQGSLQDWHYKTSLVTKRSPKSKQTEIHTAKGKIKFRLENRHYVIWISCTESETC